MRSAISLKGMQILLKCNWVYNWSIWLFYMVVTPSLRISLRNSARGLTCDRQSIYLKLGWWMTHAQMLLLRQQQGWTLDGWMVGCASRRCSAAQWPKLLRSSSKVKVGAKRDRRRRYSVYPLVSRVFLPLRT